MNYEDLIFKTLIKYKLNIKIEDLSLNTNYIKEKILKSFDLLNFITDVEIQFNIEFTPEEMYSNKIQTINGLAKLVKKKLLDKESGNI